MFIKQPDIFKTYSAYRVEYQNLEKFIVDKLGIENKTREFSIPECEECGNDTSLEYTVEPEQLDNYYTERVDHWIDGGPTPMYCLRGILCWLCYKGEILPGKYIVRVSW